MSNSAMDNKCDIAQRLDDLEIKASFREDLLEALNQTVFRQQQQIDLLLRDVARLRQQLPEAGSGVSDANPGDELPPHY